MRYARSDLCKWAPPRPPRITGEAAMKIIVSMLVALSVVAGLSASAQATFRPLNAKQIFDKLDREKP
jgi:hypothetical protein